MTHDELKAARKRLGLNIRDFATLIGINKSTISAYENRRSPIPKYVPLAIFAIEMTRKAKPQNVQSDQSASVKG
jgi:transcriptional regulator with XRE-family HTH domain